MSSASFAITLEELQIEIANDRGYSLDPKKWNPKQSYVINNVATSAIAQVYFPAPVEGKELAPDWTFLKPISEIGLDQGSQFAKMPDDFGSVDGPLAVKTNATTSTPWWIEWHNIGEIMQMYSATPSQSGPPKYACETPLREFAPNTGQRRAIMVFPLPDQDYILQLRYSINPDKLTGPSAYAYGGAQYRELYIASALAVAERRFDLVVDGPAAKHFNQMLLGAITADNKNRPAKIGYNANREGPAGYGKRHWNGMGLFYNGQPIT